MKKTMMMMMMMMMMMTIKSIFVFVAELLSSGG
jgi:hypothetical protein